MADNRLTWDETGKKLYETGVDRAVLYLQDETGAYVNGVAWNGLTGISESPSGGEETALYANNNKYGSLRSNEEFGGTIKAYTYPDEWNNCDGSKELTKGLTAKQQVRSVFGLTYRSLIGNDTKATEYGYRLHFVYGATTSPAQKDRTTVNDSPEAIELSYDFTTTAVPITGMKPASHIELDSTQVDPKVLKAVEDVIYGSATAKARLPLPDEIKSIMEQAASQE